MPKILVIADDLTGAAEIGGIAHEAGYSVRIILDPLEEKTFSEDVIIIDTNTRQLSSENAHFRIKIILHTFCVDKFDLIFKKVDSVLRGNIESEIQAFFSYTFFKSALLIPANPTRQRVIKNGEYFIKNKPINETDFRYDPEYPRKWKSVKKLIGAKNIDLITGDSTPMRWTGKLFIPDILSLEDMERYTALTYKSEVLFIGGADFFKTILSSKFMYEFSHHNAPDIEDFAQKYFILGSNTKSSLRTSKVLAEKEYAVFHISTSIVKFEGQFSKWMNSILTEFKKGNNIVLARPMEFIRDRAIRNGITNKLAKAACLLMMASRLKDLFLIEGGETASTFLRYLDWRELVICTHFDGGAVMVLHELTNRQLIIKPGSYEWPRLIIENL